MCVFFSFTLEKNQLKHNNWLNFRHMNPLTEFVLSSVSTVFDHANSSVPVRVTVENTGQCYKATVRVIFLFP
jgi:hypothetical protein